MIHVTTAATYTISGAAGLRITVNAALTGTITVADTNGTQAVITNPVVGSEYNYFGFAPGAVTVINSATADATISVFSANRS